MRVMNERRPVRAGAHKMLSRLAPRGLVAVTLAMVAAVLVLLAARPDAQGRAPIAITGARIVDGSGNEPFVGTIVFSGGRISAVGRQVDVPADAERIDGAGKAVLPGLIDAGVRAALVDTATEAGRRRLGVALASGITTAAAGVEGAPLPSSALANAVQPRLHLLGPVEPPAPAPPANVRARRNATLAIALDADPAGAAAVIRQMKARMAVSGLARDDGALDLAAVAASGLTPLEAVTAMTGGGAWALGLQSDRGLLAPGMRADLVVVAGDPSATLDALLQIERVFLGGAPVDREALLTPPPPPPPTAVPPTTAATVPESSSAPVAPRARRGRTAKPAPPSPAAATPAAPAVSEAPPAVDKPAPEPPPLVVAPAPAPKAAPKPSSSTAPPPAPATSAAVTPPPTAVAGERLREALLDDFERGESLSAVGPSWVGTASDSGGATTLIMGRVVKGLRDHALMVSARMAGREPFARAAIKLDAAERPVDVSRFRGLRFDARGEGRYRVVFVTRSVADGRYHESYFSGSPLWTPVSIPFASVGQNGAGDRVAWTGRDVVEIRFEMARDAGRLGWLELDNVTFY
jgi:hypothetical protein